MNFLRILSKLISLRLGDFALKIKFLAETQRTQRKSLNHEGHEEHEKKFITAY